jgi:acetylornithine/LysW-gamma-L-lysine aminotransferase
MGEHSSTFSGGPLACAAAAATLDVLRDEGLPEKAAANGKRLLGGLRELGENLKIIREARGMGLMIGVELRFDALNVILGALRRELLVLDAGRNVVRLLPPLVIESQHIDAVVKVLGQALEEEQAARLQG